MTEFSEKTGPVTTFTIPDVDFLPPNFDLKRFETNKKHNKKFFWNSNLEKSEETLFGQFVFDL